MISKRLQAIIDWIEGSCLADVGCDHAYVAVEAVKKHKVKKAYACDIAEGPLENAKKNIKKNHLENSISCILTSGMRDLPDDVDMVVIAGMGGKMIISILEEANISLSTHFLLSPHKDDESLRHYLNENGFTIQRERIVEEDHFYPIIDCIYKNVNQVINDYDFIYGFNPLMNNDYLHYLDYMKDKWSSILMKVPEDKKVYFQKQLDYLKTKEIVSQ